MMWRDKGVNCDTVADVEHWAREKGLIAEGNSLPQAEKTLEEAGELMDAIAEGDRDGIVDGMGDVLVTLVIQARIQGLTLQDCLDHAYAQIKDRTGKMMGGQFVKSEDLQEGD